MSEKAKKAGRRSLAQRRDILINELWGDDLDDLNVWNRKIHDGFTTIPRTLTYINRILDFLSGVGAPVSQTYLSLWCRVFDEGFIEIRDKEAIAYESGFSGQRAVTTWMGRMKKLKELGFILTKPGTAGEFHYVLMLNPLSVIRDKYEQDGVVKDERYYALYNRMLEVGAKMGLNNDCSVRKKYTDIYIDAFNEVIDLYESEGGIPKGTLKLTSINDHVLDEWFKSWYERSNRFKHGNWHWDRMIAKRRKKCKRFDLAIWSGGVLCGLTLGGVSRGNKTVRIDYIEANPNKHPLDKKIAGIAIAVAISVGQKINASHVAIFNPVNDKVESLYRQFGFQRMSIYGRFLKNVMYLEVPSPN